MVVELRIYEPQTGLVSRTFTVDATPPGKGVRRNLTKEFENSLYDPTPFAVYTSPIQDRPLNDDGMVRIGNNIRLYGHPFDKFPLRRIREIPWIYILENESWDYGAVNWLFPIFHSDCIGNASGSYHSGASHGNAHGDIFVLMTDDAFGENINTLLHCQDSFLNLRNLQLTRSPKFSDFVVEKLCQLFENDPESEFITEIIRQLFSEDKYEFTIQVLQRISEKPRMNLLYHTILTGETDYLRWTKKLTRADLNTSARAVLRVQSVEMYRFLEKRLTGFSRKCGDLVEQIGRQGLNYQVNNIEFYDFIQEKIRKKNLQKFIAGGIDVEIALLERNFDPNLKFRKLLEQFNPDEIIEIIKGLNFDTQQKLNFDEIFHLVFDKNNCGWTKVLMFLCHDLLLDPPLALRNEVANDPSHSRYFLWYWSANVFRLQQRAGLAIFYKKLRQNVHIDWMNTCTSVAIFRIAMYFGWWHLALKIVIEEECQCEEQCYEHEDLYRITSSRCENDRVSNLIEAFCQHTGVYPSDKLIGMVSAQKDASNEVIDSLEKYSPMMIELRNSDATQVEEILKSMNVKEFLHFYRNYLLCPEHEFSVETRHLIQQKASNLFDIWRKIGIHSVNLHPNAILSTRIDDIVNDILDENQ